MTYLISNLLRKKGKFVIIIINSVVDPDPNYIGIQQHCRSKLGQKIQDPDPNINVESTVKQFFFNIYKNNFNGAVIWNHQSRFSRFPLASVLKFTRRINNKLT